MRVLTIAAAMFLFLCACTQPPDIPDNELFDCDLSKDGKFLICHERKQTRVAGD